MNYLHRLLEFDTVEQGRKNHAEAMKLQRSMVGQLYASILFDDCAEIAAKLSALEYIEYKKREEVRE